MTISAIRLTGIYLVCLMMNACTSLPSSDLLGGQSVNFATGSAIGSRLAGSDVNALGEAFDTAMATGQDQRWNGRRASGVVMPGKYAVANLRSDPRERLDLAHRDLNFAQIVETELGLYVLIRNSNIRKGPGTDQEIVEVLPSGSGVDVVGKVSDANWMLVAADGVVRGYVYGNLLIKAPGTELELAGGPNRKPLLCRNFKQRLNIFSERDEWSGAACNDGTGWRLAEDPPGPQQIIDDELLGL